jgi:HAMP domain-containing protein
MTPLLVIVAVAVVVMLVFLVVAAKRNRRPPDDIDSFRRQIDALSPEARRETSDRMKPSDGRSTGDDGGNGT